AVVAAHTEDGAVQYLGVGVEQVLELGGADVAADHDDQVLDPVDDGQVALGVEESDVAGVQPAVAQHLGGQLGLLPDPGVLGREGAVLETAGRLQADVAVDDAAQEADGVCPVGLGQVVTAQDRPQHQGVPDGGAAGRRVRIEPELGGGVTAGVLPGV